VSHLYALFGGPEEDEVRVKGQRLAKVWMNKAVDGIERARKHVGLRFRGTSELNGPRQCHHEGPPMESRPCVIQARAAARRADRAWRKRPRRIKGLCDGLTDGADESGGDLAPVEGPEGESESSSDSSDSESNTDCFESCDPHSPDSRGSPTPLTWDQGGGARSLLARVTPTPPPAPLTREDRIQVAPTRASPSRPHRTPRWILLPRHHPWRKRRNSAGR
jgi:hypothetical protein